MKTDDRQLGTLVYLTNESNRMDLIFALSVGAPVLAETVLTKWTFYLTTFSEVYSTAYYCDIINSL